MKRTSHHLLLLLTKQKLKEERQPKPRGRRGEGTAPSPILPLTVDGHVAAHGYKYGYELDDGISQLEPRTQWTHGQLDTEMQEGHPSAVRTAFVMDDEFLRNKSGRRSDTFQEETECWCPCKEVTS